MTPEQTELGFDDLSDEEQEVYLRAAQLLLDGDDGEINDDGVSVCAACGQEAPEHMSWCPLGADLLPE